MAQGDTASLTPSEGDVASYVLKWYHGKGRRYGWFVWGIQPDRSFYGEVTIFTDDGGKQVSVRGRLSESDYARFLLLVREIEGRTAGDESDAPWEGLLAVGPANTPRILFRYRQSDQTGSELGETFLKLVDVIAPYLRRFHESLE